MKKAFLIVLLLPFFANAQIYYPTGRSDDDSTTFTFSNGDSLVHTLSYSWGGSTSVISIDTARDSSSTVLWQIGNTLKPVFSNDTIAIRGIMTDTLNPYPPNANSFFTIEINPSASNFIVDFWHRYETDSLHAGGIVEFSSDTGVTWMNIANCTSINKQNFYLPTDTIASGDAAFTGTSNGEQLSRFQFMNCYGQKTTATSCTLFLNFEYRQPILFRFRFVSDSTIDSLPGWIIDSIRIENPGCVPGYVSEVSEKNTLNISPNPATTELMISSAYKITNITITNLPGQTVYTHNYNTEQVEVDVADLPAGIYFVKVNGSEVRKFVKE